MLNKLRKKLKRIRLILFGDRNCDTFKVINLYSIYKSLDINNRNRLLCSLTSISLYSNLRHLKILIRFLSKIK